MGFGSYLQPQTLVSVSVCLSVSLLRTHTHSRDVCVCLRLWLMHACNQHTRLLACSFFSVDASTQVLMCLSRLLKLKSLQTLYRPPTDAPQWFPIRPQSIIIIHSHQETEPPHLLHQTPPPIIPTLIVSRPLFNLLTGSKYVLYLILNIHKTSKSNQYLLLWVHCSPEAYAGECGDCVGLQRCRVSDRVKASWHFHEQYVNAGRSDVSTLHMWRSDGVDGKNSS